MPVSITIRGVPDEVRDELAARAARAGRSLQEHLRLELIALAERPSVDDWIEQVRADKRAKPTRVPVRAILAARDRDRR